MDDAIGVEVGQGQRSVVDQADLNVVGQWTGSTLQELGQALVHQLHQENGPEILRLSHQAQELDDAGVLQVAEEHAFLLESRRKVDLSRVVGAKEGGVEEFGGTGQLVQRGPAYTAVGAHTEASRWLHSHTLVAKLALQLDYYVISHASRVIRVNLQGLVLNQWKNSLASKPCYFTHTNTLLTEADGAVC